MDSGQQEFGGLLAPALKNERGMVVAHAFKPRITPSAIRDDFRPRRHHLSHKSTQASRRGVRDPLKANPPSFRAPDLGGNGYQGFRMSEHQSSGITLVSSDHDFVDFDLSGQGLPARSNHTSPQLVQTRPSRPIAAHAQYPLQPQCTHAPFLAHNPPNRTEPKSEGDMASVEDGAGRDRDVRSAGTAVQQPAGGLPSLAMPASRAAKTLWPAHPYQISPAGLLCAKPMFEFEERLRI